MKTAYYNCFDSKCGARGLILFEHELIDKYEFNEKFIDKENFILTKKHTKKYDNHSFI